MKKWVYLLVPLALSGCASTRMAPEAMAPVDIRIIGINDFHGALDPPKAATDTLNAAGEKVRIPSGGVAYLASAINSLKAAAPNNIVVGAGDLIGASPLSSSLFLDEPSIMAMGMVGLEFSAVGNDESTAAPTNCCACNRAGAKSSPRPSPAASTGPSPVPNSGCSPPTRRRRTAAPCSRPMP